MQWKRSTWTKDRRLAMRVAAELEDAAQGRREPDGVKGWLTANVPDTRARRGLTTIFDEVLREATGHGLSSRTTRTYAGEWLELRKLEVKEASAKKYADTVKAFLASLGAKADLDVSAIRREDIARFRDECRQRTSAGTANVALKIIRMIFRQAHRDGLVLRDEAAAVKGLKSSEEETRRPFTEEEISRVLAVCDAEWRSIILFAIYTGARLGDIATMTWRRFDAMRGTLMFSTAKTGRAVYLPVPPPLLAHIASLPASDDPRAALHTRAAAAFARSGRTNTLSREFGEILAAAGLAEKRTHKKRRDGKGRGARRVSNELCFHCFRHTAVSMMKNAGAPEAVVRDIVGHENAAINRHYTHVSDEAKREALAKLPDFVSGQTNEG